MPFKPRSLRDYEEQLEAQRQNMTIEDQYKSARVRMQERQRQTAAADIQRVWRGHVTRKPLKGLLDDPRKRARNRALDKRTRASPLYKVKVFRLAMTRYSNP